MLGLKVRCILVIQWLFRIKLKYILRKLYTCHYSIDILLINSADKLQKLPLARSFNYQLKKKICVFLLFQVVNQFFILKLFCLFHFLCLEHPSIPNVLLPTFTISLTPLVIQFIILIGWGVIPSQGQGKGRWRAFV